MIVSGIEIEVVKKNIKNMHLSVLPPMGKVRISAPTNTSYDTINLFAITKIGWIKKQIEGFENQTRQSERKYVSGESHYIWGRRYKMKIRYTKIKNNIGIKANKLVLTVRENSTQQQRENIMKEWYRAEIKAKLPALIEKWEAVIGVKSNAVSVKNMLTRWGTCNVEVKRIWVNLQLAKKPVNCLEYIVVHELVHLIERKHTTVFVDYMDKFLPNWRIVKEELNSFIMDKYLQE